MSVFDPDHWQEIFEALAKNKLRTLLTAFGVFWGIFLLVILLASGNGLHNGVMAGFSDVATNSFFVWGMRTSRPYKGLQPGRAVEFTNDDTAAIRREVASVEVVSPRAQLGGHRGSNRWSAAPSRARSRHGRPSRDLHHPVPGARRGRFINDIDIREARKVAVIGTRPLEVLFAKGEDPIGQAVEINGVWFKVVGSSSRDRAAAWPSATPDDLRPLHHLPAGVQLPQPVQWFAVTSKSGFPASVAQEEVLQLLRARHQVAPEDKRAIGGFNLEEQFGKIQGLFAGIGALMWLVGVGTLAAGAIGVSNIMLIIVRERTKEIGLRRAVGARPLDRAADRRRSGDPDLGGRPARPLRRGRSHGVVARLVPATAAGGGRRCSRTPPCRSPSPSRRWSFSSSPGRLPASPPPSGRSPSPPSSRYAPSERRRMETRSE